MYPSPSVAKAYQTAIARHCGIDVESELVRSTIGAALRSRSNSSDLTTCEEAERSFWAGLIHSLCPSQDGFQSCFDELFEHFGSSDNWKCFPDVGGVVERLREHGVKVAIASNFDDRLNSVCDGLKDLQTVDCRIVSSLVGYRKPAPQFFDAVVTQLGVDTQNVLMVGDDVVNDVRGALESGLQAALIDRDSAIADSKLPETVVRIDDLGQICDLIEQSVAFGSTQM